jgi:hypothetical protein
LLSLDGFDELVEVATKIRSEGLRPHVDEESPKVVHTICDADPRANLPLHASAAQIEMESAPGSTSSGVATTPPGLDLFQSRDLHNRSQLGSCKPATDLQEANVSGSLSMLEKDLDSLLQGGKPEATACRGASGCSGTGDLVITSLPEGALCFGRA